MNNAQQKLFVWDCDDCYAVPGDDSIIDVINPVTGLSWYAGETLEQIQLRHPGAIKMSLEWYSAAKALRQDTPVVWMEVNEEHYTTMLEILPPAFWGNQGFLVGEAADHHASSGLPRYAAYRVIDGIYMAADRPMTIAEFKALQEPAA